jgi:hypothetical protein
MAPSPALPRLRARYERLKASLAALGPVQQGSLAERIDRRPDAHGRPRQRGPYYQWTFKEAGQTRTVKLTREQAGLWGQAIRRHRRLEKTLQAMREVSLQILRESAAGVPPRRRHARKRTP